jgi:hypothetical protein
VIHDAGTEFGREFGDLLSSNGIQEVTTTVKNPRANAILERVHGVIGDMLRTYDFENQNFDTFGKDRQDPFNGFLASVAFAVLGLLTKLRLVLVPLLWYFSETCSSRRSTPQTGDHKQLTVRLSSTMELSGKTPRDSHIAIALVIES